MERVTLPKATLPKASLPKVMPDGHSALTPTRNLLLHSGKPIENSEYLIASYIITEPPADGERCTLTIWGELNVIKRNFSALNSDSVTFLVEMKYDSRIGAYTSSFDWVSKNDKNTHVNIYQTPISKVGISRIDRIKLERGECLNPKWSPAPEDKYDTPATLELLYDESFPEIPIIRDNEIPIIPNTYN